MRSKTILLAGGLDLETPAIAVKEGFALEANNVEPNLMGGYRHILGYERLDGRVAPSDGVYYGLYVDNSTLETVGTTITGSISGATANITSKDDTLNLLGITNLSGNFVINDVLNAATTTGGEDLAAHPDIATGAQWELDAQNYYRNLIQPVSGVGSILGCWQYEGVRYAFRSNGTVVKMFKSTTSGWAEVTLFSVLKFDTGVLADGDIVAGDTITGLTSSAIGTVKNFIKVSGSYGSTAAGYMVVDVTAGTFTGGEDIQKGGVTKVSADGADYAISFTLGANKFKFDNYNFHGASNLRRMYGCDGVNNAFEFDGTVLTPIITGMDNDAPVALEPHINQLFLAFAGGSLQHSAPTEPLVFNAILGAAELTVGEEVGDLKSIAENALLVSTKRNVSVLYGSSVANWELKLAAIETGDVGDTLDVIGSPLFVSKRGIVRIDPSDVYGNFESATVSRRINPLLSGLVATKTVVGASIFRDKNEYRIYFDDGKGIMLTHDALFGEGALPSFTTFEYADAPTCVASVPVDQGQEVLLFGSTDGFVYQEERGYSFDGGTIDYSLKLPYHHLGSPSLRKAFKWVNVEIDTTRTTSLKMTYEFSDGQSHTSTSAETSFTLAADGAVKWGLVNWGEFVWGSQDVTRSPTSLDGTGNNISLFFFGSSAIDTDFTISSLTYQYINRRPERG